MVDGEALLLSYEEEDLEAFQAANLWLFVVPSLQNY